MNRRTITRIRTTVDGQVDKYGDAIAVPDGDPDAETSIDGCLVAPRYSNELQDRGRGGVIVGLAVYAPPGADIVSTDQFDIDGTRYEVDGEPGVWTGSNVGGVEVPLRRVAG